MNLSGKTGIGAVLAALLTMTVACGGGGADDAAYPIHPTDELVATGQPVYAANCASCHGDGNQPPPLPSAPSHGDDGHTWHHPDRLLVEWVLDGVPGGTTMPRFRGTLTEDEVRAALAYIKTFWSSEVREFQRAGTEQYEAQIAQSGR